MSSPFEIDVSFLMAMMFGATVCIYALLAVSVFADALTIVLTLGFSTLASDLWFWSFLPFAAFLTDRMTSSMYQVSEDKKILLGKFCLWMFYLMFPVLFFVEYSVAYIVSRNVMSLVFPVLFVTLSLVQYISLAKMIRLV